MLRQILSHGPTGSPRLLSCGHQAPESPTVVGVNVECRRCDRRQLPAQVTTGRRTPTFATGTVPSGLLRDHRTATWARLEVEAGSVTFREEEPRWRTTVTSGQSVTIIPDRPHRIEPSDDARLAIQFFDLPAPSAGEAGDRSR